MGKKKKGWRRRWKKGTLIECFIGRIDLIETKQLQTNHAVQIKRKKRKKRKRKKRKMW